MNTELMFIGFYVLAFHEVSGTGIVSGVDVLRRQLHLSTDRVWTRRRKDEWIGVDARVGVYLGARGIPIGIQIGPVGIRTTDAERIASSRLATIAFPCIAAWFADGTETVLQPAQTDLLETTIRVAIAVLGDDRRIVGSSIPRSDDVAAIAACGSHSPTDLVAGTSVELHVMAATTEVLFGNEDGFHILVVAIDTTARLDRGQKTSDHHHTETSKATSGNPETIRIVHWIQSSHYIQMNV